MNNIDSVSLYVNWVLHAVYGRLGEADLIMRHGARDIGLVAGFLNHKFPIASKPLYRGVLIDPGSHGKSYPFVSWSEDRDVACWFADRNSQISTEFAAYAPRARGHLIALAAPKSRVLWHHAWRYTLGFPIEDLALRHPFMGPEGHRQIAWSLDTQLEVITEPVEDLALAPYEAMVDETKRLDEKLTPPWIKAQAALEGARGEA